MAACISAFVFSEETFEFHLLLVLISFDQPCHARSHIPASFTCLTIILTS